MPPKYVFMRRRRRRGDEDEEGPEEPPNEAQVGAPPPPQHYTDMTYQEQVAFLVNNARQGIFPSGNINNGAGHRIRAIRWMIVVRLNLNQHNYILPNPIPASAVLPTTIAFVTGQYENPPEILNPRFGPNGHIQIYLESQPGNALLDWVHLMIAFGWGMPGSDIQAAQVWMSPSFAPSRQQAIEYVNKEHTRWNEHPSGGTFEWGEQANNGNVAEANQEIMNAIEQNEEWPDIVARFGPQALRFAAGYMRCINERLKYHEPPAKKKLVFCLFGASNKGKTTKVYEYAESKGTKVYKKGKSSFWEGYAPKKHGVVLFDEFRGSKSLDFDEFRKIVDDQAYPLDVKNSFCWVGADAFFFNSNVAPLEWYSFSNEDEQSSFWRRFTGGVYQYAKDGSIIPHKLPLPEFAEAVSELFNVPLEIGKPFVDMLAKWNKDRAPPPI